MHTVKGAAAEFLRLPLHFIKTKFCRTVTKNITPRCGQNCCTRNTPPLAGKDY